MNFFALIVGRGLEVRRLPLEQPLQGELEERFSAQENELFQNAPDEVEFSPGHEPDTSEIVYIPNFELPEPIQNAIAAPIEQEVLRLDGDVGHRVRGIVGAERDARRILFQNFDRRRLLVTGFTLLVSGETYRRLKDPGLVIDNRLAAVFRDGRLFFRSFFNARRVLDLSAYYREATDEDLEAFGKDPKVFLETPGTLVENGDEWVRKRIALLRDSKVMTDVAPRKVVAVGKDFDLNIEVKRKEGKEAVLFPSNKKELKALLRFLGENYYKAPLTGDRFIANSKRPLKKPRR